MCACSEEDSTAAASTTAVTVAEGMRELKGVMRVGLLAKGLLLHGDLELQLVVLCHNRPTKSLLLFLAERLPAELVVSVISFVYFDVAFNHFTCIYHLYLCILAVYFLVTYGCIRLLKSGRRLLLSCLTA